MADYLIRKLWIPIEAAAQDGYVGEIKIDPNDTTLGFLSQKLLAGSNITLTKNNIGANETLTVASAGGSSTDEKVKITSADTTSNYLQSKLIAGPSITITKNNAGANETLTIDGYALPKWTYLSVTPPTGAAAPEAVWQFDKSASEFTDRTGNGHTLSSTGHDNQQWSNNNGLVGRALIGADRYFNSTPGNLKILGALTIELQFDLRSVVVGNDEHIITCVGDSNSETEANNVLYRIANTSAAGLYKFVYFAEYGAGNNSLITFGTAATHGPIMYLALTRNGSTGLLKLYLNGTLMETAASTLPTGGSNSTFYLGNSDLTNWMNGNLFSVRITASEYTAAQIKETWVQISPYGA